jgi:hypothetical protein
MTPRGMGHFATDGIKRKKSVCWQIGLQGGDNMITGKQLKRLANTRVVELASSQSEQFNTGFRFGYESALKDAGAREMALFDTLDAAEKWAKINCPAQMGQTCKAGCNRCMDVPLPVGLVKRTNS